MPTLAELTFEDVLYGSARYQRWRVNRDRRRKHRSEQVTKNVLARVEMDRRGQLGVAQLMSPRGSWALSTHDEAFERREVVV